MFKYMTARLNRRLITLCLLQALVPILVVGVLAYNKAKSSLEQGAFSKLEAVAEIKRTQIRRYLGERMTDAELLAQTEDVARAIQELSDYHAANGGDPSGGYDVDSEEYRTISRRLDPFFSKYTAASRYHDVFLISARHGHVMYTAAKERDLGTNLKIGFLRNSGLASVWSKTLQDREACLVDIAHYEPSNTPAGFIGVPVHDEQGEINAVLALQINIDTINDLMLQRSGMGETGETYLVGKDLLMRSDSRFSDESTILERKVDTRGVREALADRQGTEIFEDYRGVSVLSCYSHVGLNEVLGTDFDWAILSEIDAAEAFAPVRALRSRVILVGLVLIVLAGLVGFFSSRSISRPLELLAVKVGRIASGDLRVETEESRRQDEVGDLERGFRNMVEALREQTRRLQEGASALASSLTEISATTSQFAASAAETSTAVSEITTTVEEVRQTATVSSEKARQVADRATALAGISDTGRQATGEAETGMQQINEEMEYVAETILSLSEQTQSIGEIISAVNNLADQSNLLSVNASIEAAKAGEFGKGFAVVAQEVKTLADQSREATGQVKTILNDIQQAASTAVMATERGNKAVASGTGVSSRAGAALVELSEGVSESVQIATHIAASNKEQLVGLDQLAEAMRGIKDATQQNVDGAKQIDEAGKALRDLSSELQNMAARFTI